MGRMPEPASALGTVAPTLSTLCLDKLCRSRHRCDNGTGSVLSTGCVPMIQAQALELRRVLEGERAQRSQAAREFKQLEKRAAAARSPALQLASPLPAALAALPTSEADQRRAALERRIAQHSAQVSGGRRSCLISRGHSTHIECKCRILVTQQ